MINNTKLFSIWKADETSVETIALPPGNDTLLSAGKLIKLWDLKTKDLLQVYIILIKILGHDQYATNLLDFVSFVFYYSHKDQGHKHLL